MSPPAVFAPAAQADLRAAVAWIAQENPASARTLRDIAGAQRIGARPSIGATRPFVGADRFRFLVLRAFSYLMVYSADTDPPRILSVLHTARD
ncbi:MAG: type II toxin-antitoxin system RelE/ParE family toxin [Paracraurococcus sp.]